MNLNFCIGKSTEIFGASYSPKVLNKLAIENFCEYLKIKTVHPNPDYSGAVEFLKEQCQQLELEFNSFELAPNNPFVCLKWNGIDKDLKSVVLYSHMDVVPVFPDKWIHPPFSAHIDENGNIYARGSQDMKCVGSQYLEAIRRIKCHSPNYRPERNIYVLFGPDEELGGVYGMQLLVESEIFKNMNIGFVMDEGLASEGEEYPVFYGDRLVWWLKVYVHGNTGHGSQFIKNSAGVKANLILNKFMNLRNSEEIRMVENGLTLGDVTTVNLTGTSGGVQHNVVSSPFTFDFDIRVSPLTNLTEFRQMLEGWKDECGGGIEYKFVQFNPEAYLTSLDSNNPWWTAFESICKSLSMCIVPQVFPAGTDSRHIRMKGIPAIGFSPMNKTPVLLHDHNEFINIDTFIRGIDFYEKLIPALAAALETKL